MTTEVTLTVEADPCEPTLIAVRVGSHSPELKASLRCHLEGGGKLSSLIRVNVMQTTPSFDEVMPDILGHYRILDDGLWFTPLFPFESGIRYVATFDARSFGNLHPSNSKKLEFLLPSTFGNGPSLVTNIFPSSAFLPENLLRFYVCFSNPMQRGRVQREISIIGPDGQPAPDVLYRAPVELWDRSMRQLTVLLDPGRLKRGVGPNRHLGPPLTVGQTYTLAVGRGMIDCFGNPLADPVYKKFYITEASREAIVVQLWRVIPPPSGTFLPLIVVFSRPLDWALLLHTINVESICGQKIEGIVGISQAEEQWSFVPKAPWVRGSYRIRVAPDLEDVCGNSILAAFDRSLRPGNDLLSEGEVTVIPLELT